MPARWFVRKDGPVDIEGKDRLARANDSSNAAAGWRLGAAIRAIGMTPSEFARRSGQAPNAIFNSMGGRNFPSVKTMRALYRQHDIDPAFIMFGEYRKLPMDVQDRIFAALEDETRRHAQREGGDVVNDH